MLRIFNLHGFLSLFICLTFVFGINANATSTQWKGSFENFIRLVVAKKEGNTITAGIEFKTPPKHHTYWKHPGEVGFSPNFNFAGSKNIASHKVIWPTPTRFKEDGFNTYGYYTNKYERNFILPFEIVLEDPRKETDINLNFFGAVCHTTCIPVQQDFSLKINSENYYNSTELESIEYFKGKVPKANTNSIMQVSFKDATGTIITKTDIDDLFVDSNPQFENILVNTPKMVGSNEQGKTWEVEFLHADERKQLALKDLEPFNIIFIAKDRLGSQQQLVKPAQGIAYKLNTKTIDTSAKVANNLNKPKREARSLLTYIFFAFIGGLILNLMPCVLPVLSIKAFSFLKMEGKEKSVVQGSFLFSAFGIIATFLALGLIATIIQMAGTSVVWGQHFQYVWVILAFVLLLTLFAANLFGTLNFGLPSWVGDKSLKFDESSKLGSFMTGVFATLLATPCTAPLLGTAIGFALSQGPLEIMLISLFVGVGMALPYLLFVFAPSLIRFLPKPGGWMNKLKYILGFLVLLTALWLVWFVLYPNNGFTYAVIVTIIVFAILLRLWANKKGSLLFKLVSVFGAVGLILFSLYTLPSLVGADPLASDKSDFSNIEIIAFNPNKINEYVAEGKTVFLDITADWCATCKVNKALVLDTKDINKLLSSPNIVFMQGDMTKPNKEILLYLREWHRAGIPFNAVFGPSAANGILLSEILTKSAVIEAVNQAK